MWEFVITLDIPEEKVAEAYAAMQDAVMDIVRETGARLKDGVCIRKKEGRS